MAADVVNDVICLPYRAGVKNFKYSAIESQALKNSNCFFCVTACNSKSLEDHLNNFPVCRRKYLDLTGTSSTIAAILTVVNCLNCEETFPRLESHLLSNNSCLKAFETTLDVQGIK